MRQIAFLTDAHLKDPSALKDGINPMKNLEKALEDLSERNIKEIIYGGDIGKTEEYPIFFEMLSEFRWKIILGNHDNLKDIAPYFDPSQENMELYYLEEDDDLILLFMDTSSAEVSKEQLEWLKMNLDTDKNLLLFIHHPVLSLDTAMDKKHPLKNREEVRAVLEESGKEINIFCGHYHMSDERREGNIRQFITQALSFQVEKDADEVRHTNSHFGYRIIKIASDVIDTELITFQNQ